MESEEDDLFIVSRIKLSIFKVIIFTVIINLVFFNIQQVRAEDNLEVGQYVKFGECFDKPIIWRVIHKVTNDEVYKQGENTNIYKNKGTKEGDLLLLSDKILIFENHENTIGWMNSKLKEWLNSTYTEGTVIMSLNISYASYDDKKSGFLCSTNFSKKEIDMIRNVTHKYLINTEVDESDGGSKVVLYKDMQPDDGLNVYDDCYYKNTTDKVFLLSIKELSQYIDGKLFHSDGMDYHKSYATYEALKKSFFNNTDNSKIYSYWIRDSCNSTNTSRYYISSEGKIETFNNVGSLLFNANSGIRPAIYVDVNGARLSGGSGNSESDAIELIPADKEKPSGTFSSSSDSLSNHDIIVKFNPFDSDSGVEKWVYWVYSDGNTEYGVVVGDVTKEIVLTKNGNNKIKVIIYDKAGNSKTLYRDYIIDKIKPNIPVILIDPDNMTNKNIKVSISYSNDSIVKEYKINDGSWKTYTKEFIISENCKITARGKDQAGNYSEETVCDILNIDKIRPNKPTISIDTNSITNQNVIVSISYTNDSIIKEYKINNGSWKTYTKEFSISENCKIIARGKDQAGNYSEETVCDILNIDKIRPNKPTISIDTNSITNQNVIVSISYSDDSIIKEYKINDGSWKAYIKEFIIGENCKITARGKDQAGNYSEETVCDISNIDKIGPSDATFKLSTIELTNQNVIVVINYADDAIIKEYKIGEKSNFINYSNPIEVDKNCTIYVRGYDIAGNESNVTSISIVNIDKENPVYPVITYNPKRTTNKNVNISISYSDDSIIKEYKINDGSWEAYTKEFTISENCKIIARGKDQAGNYSSEICSNILNIIKRVLKMPIISMDRGIYTKKIEVQIVQGDRECKDIYYTLDGSEPDENSIRYNKKIKIDGKHNEEVILKAIAYDGIGNKSNVVEKTYKFNKELVNLKKENRKNFRYYIGIDKYGLVKAMLVSKTGQDLNFNKSDILEMKGKFKGYFKDGIIYINNKGLFKKYKRK